MRADVEQRARLPRADAAIELAEDRREDQVLVARVELAGNPLIRPALRVHAIEEPRQRGQTLRLAESAGPASDDPDVATAVRKQLRVLVLELTEVERREMGSCEAPSAAHPARIDRLERRRRLGDGRLPDGASAAHAISAAI